MLYHNADIKHFDPYFGVRIGENYWYDSPMPYNDNSIWPKYFLTQQSLKVFNFQLVVGFRYFPIYNLGIHFKFGIGSPYLAEGGITFRINTKKEKPTNDMGIKPKTN